MDIFYTLSNCKCQKHSQNSTQSDNEINTAKSQISCGISWNRTAIEVEIPAGILIRKLAQIINQSIKLCTKSHTRFMIANGCVCSLESTWWQWFRWTIFSTKSQITIHHKINPQTNSIEIFSHSSTNSGNKWKNTSQSNAHAEKATK